MKVSSLYEALLKNPEAPKPYRELRDYYKKIGMFDEAEGFTTLLQEHYNEQIMWEDVNLPNIDPK